MRTTGAFTALFAVIAFMFAINVFLDAQTLTPTQRADSELGDATASITLLDLEIASGGARGDRLREAFDDDESGLSLAINATSFPFYKSGLQGIYFSERDWNRSSPDRQYRLVHGQWPTAPGDVAVAGHGLTGIEVGDQVKSPGGGVLTVVGVGESRLTDRPIMLAAPGTWSSMGAPAPGDSDLLAAFPSFQSESASPEDFIDGVSAALKADAPEEFASLSPADLRDLLGERLRSRQQAEAEAPRLWTTQSPLSLWIPGLILIPMCLAMGYLILMRRLIPAMRHMIIQGVKQTTAASAVWLVPVQTVVIFVVVAAAVGTLLGYQLAKTGTGQWGYLTANIRPPWAALMVSVVGIAVSLSGMFIVIQVQASQSIRWRLPTRMQERFTVARQWMATAVACVTIWKLLTLSDPGDSMLLTGAAALASALMAPELVGGMLLLMPQRSLIQKLVARQVATNRSRVATAMGVYIVLVAVTVGVLTILYSNVEMLRQRQPTSVPPGHLLVDTNSTPFKYPDRGVVAALQTVPAVRDQVPIQLYMIGERFVTKAGFEDVKNTVGTPDLPGISFAFQSVSDLEAALSVELDGAQRSTLMEGGALVVNPDLVAIRAGRIALVNNTSMGKVGELDAMAVDPEPTRWIGSVPFVALRSTAERLGLPTRPGAILYTDIPKDELDLASGALLDAGYSPKLIGTFEPPPPVVPPAALVGSAAGLMVLLIAVSLLVTRAQVRAMRPWSDRLTHLGVSSRWAKRAIIMQYCWVVAVAVPIGLAVAVVTLGATRVRLPSLDFVVPWAPIALVAAVLVLATLGGGALATRTIGAGVGLESE